MAIKGDIDLTTNCDFRHDREDKINRLAESSKIVPWHSELNITPKYIADLRSTFNATINGRNFTVDYDYDTNGNTSAIRIIYNGQSITSNGIQDILDDTIIENSITESYYMNNWDYNYDTTTTTWNNSWSYRRNLETEKEYRYPWKNPLKHIKNMLKIHDKLKIKTVCYECGKEYLDIFNDTDFSTCKRCAFIKRFGDYNLLKYHTVLPWNNSKNNTYSASWRYWRRRLGLYYEAPWVPGDKESKSKDDSKFTVKDIPWIKAIDSYRKRDDYIKDLYEEQDYSSYLTNMGWLGLHD